MPSVSYAVLSGVQEAGKPSKGVTSAWFDETSRLQQGMKLPIYFTIEADHETRIMRRGGCCWQEAR